MAASAAAYASTSRAKVPAGEEQGFRTTETSSKSSVTSFQSDAAVGSGGESLAPSPRPSSGSPPTRKVSSTPHALTPYDFTFISTLGEGSFSTVYYANEVKTQREFAIKVCIKQHIVKEKKTQYVHREKDVLKMLAGNYHPFFVRVYATFHDATKLYFVLTLAKNGELLDYLKKLGSFDDRASVFYAAEIVVALEHLHKLGIIHRDLKPENILLSEDMHIKISDFGCAKILGSEDVDGSRPTPLLPPVEKKRSSFVGTAQYLSPEVLNGKPANFSCDFWALGCIIYQMLSGLPPFRAANEYLMFQKITKLDYSFPEGFPEVAKDLINRLLQIEPSERIGADERGGVNELKMHRFFEGIRWDNLQEQTPPNLLPYLPSIGDQPAFHSNYKAQENVEPGLDDRQLTRLLGLQLADTRPTQSREPQHIMDISEKDKSTRMKDQIKNNRYHEFVEDNLILKSGLVDKRKGLFARRRMLLLTEGPHLYYVDPAHMELKGQIPWSQQLRPEAKNFKTFFVHTPNRTYYLEDPSGHAPDWCDAIEQARQFYYCNS